MFIFINELIDWQQKQQFNCVNLMMDAVKIPDKVEIEELPRTKMSDTAQFIGPCKSKM